jgi:hypothetical protein
MNEARLIRRVYARLARQNRWGNPKDVEMTWDDLLHRRVRPDTGPSRDQIAEARVAARIRAEEARSGGGGPCVLGVAS